MLEAGLPCRRILLHISPLKLAQYPTSKIKLTLKLSHPAHCFRRLRGINKVQHWFAQVHRSRQITYKFGVMRAIDSD